MRGFQYWKGANWGGKGRKKNLILLQKPGHVSPLIAYFGECFSVLWSFHQPERLPPESLDQAHLISFVSSPAFLTSNFFDFSFFFFSFCKFFSTALVSAFNCLAVLFFLIQFFSFVRIKRSSVSHLKHLQFYLRFCDNNSYVIVKISNHN